MSAALQHLAYQLLLRLLSPLLLLLGRKQDPSRWLERLGYYNAALPSRPIWLHAASYGEAKAAGLLIEALRNQGYQGSLLVTTTTRTGGEAISPFLHPSDSHRYAPVDLPWAIRRVLVQSQPRLLIVMEVEIWPNLWRLCRCQGIPIVLANARLSASSARRYQQLLPRLWENTLRRATKILAQSSTIAERFESLGAAAEQLRVCGNLKYDLSVNPDILQAGQQLRQLLGTERPIWLAASTHVGEELLVINSHKQLLEKYPELLLVIVPRHPQRFDEVWQLCSDSALKAVRRSDQSETPLEAAVQLYLADTLGELLVFYAASDLCLVAGSFVNVGGHNILEPAAYRCPIIVGPDVRNFTDIIQEFSDADALTQLDSQAELSAAVEGLLQSPQRRAVGIDNAAACLNNYRGTAVAQAVEIMDLLPS